MSGPDNSITGREPPHSVEMEEYLLSCCLLDGGDTLARCLESRLSPQVFYLPANRVIFEKLIEVYQKCPPVAIEKLIEELRPSGQLEAVGGVPYLMQVSSRIPTTAQAGFFIGKVRDLYLSRELIRAATGAAERAFDGESPTALLAGFDALREDVAFANATLTERLNAALLDLSAEPPELRTVYALKGIPIATPGNICAIYGQSKVGKGALAYAMMGAAMANGRDGDFLGASASNPQGWALVHYDSEQSRRHHWQNIQTSLKRANLKTAPPWFRSYHVKGWSVAERRLSLEYALRQAKRKFGGVHSLILDGAADFVIDPNDSGECFPFVDQLGAFAENFDCPVLVIIHQNPGNLEKGRGHLGSQLERRSESNLVLEKDGESGRTVVYSTKQRGAPILKADGPCFRWDDKEQMHTTVETLRVERDAQASESARELAREVFTGRGGLTYSAVMAAIKSACGCCDRTAEKKFKQLRDHNAIERFPPNLWALAA